MDPAGGPRSAARAGPHLTQTLMLTPRAYRIVLPLLDAVAVFAIFNLVFWLRGAQPWGVVTGWPLLAPYVFLAGALYLIDGYRAGTEMMSLDYTSQHLIATGAALVPTLLVTFVVIPADFPLQGSRTSIVVSFVLLAALTLSYRRSLHRWVDETWQERVILFLGDESSGEEFRATCRAHAMNQPVLCATIAADFEPQFRVPKSNAFRPWPELLDDVREQRLAVEAIVLREFSAPLSPAVTEDLLELYFGGVPTYTLELFYETYWRKIPLYRLNNTWMFQQGFQIARNPVFERGKRMCDILLSSLGLVLLSPLLLLAAAAIRLDDGGPVLFRQPRVGRNRRPFAIAKLRTMRTNSATADAQPYTQTDDPRITRIGRLLRATRLDEVPQLWNVLKGEMSLIGPRAEWVRLVEQYERDIPCYHFRHLVRPGITGWAQVNYPYGASVEDTLRKLEYDLYYLRHFSFIMDASIVLKTIHLMLSGKGQ